MNFVWLQQSLQDETGRYSSARLINILVCFAALPMMFWMTYADKMTEGIFGLFLAYGMGTHGWNKYVEGKQPKAEESK